MKITIGRAVLAQAFDAIDQSLITDEVRASILDALAQPRQDPVAVFELEDSGWEIVCDGDWIKTLPVGTKLYTSPPSREPLTHGDLDLCRQWFGCIQDTNPSYIGRNDCALAAKLYTRLGLPIPKELQGASAHGIKDTP
jgi:hypothetical protein